MKTSIKNKYSVQPINPSETYDWIRNKHYLKRTTSVSFAFGLYEQKILQGICTFGNALPMQMKKSVCGELYMDDVYELNRLCINEPYQKNALSYFVANCLKLLISPKIIVSYADIEQGHNGYIYQATNWIYTGLSHVQLDWRLRGREHIHSRTLMDEFKYEENRIEKLKEKYGDALYQVQRKPKHRYIYFVGNKKHRKNYNNSFIPKKISYPKGDNKRYDASYEPEVQLNIW